MSTRLTGRNPLAYLGVEPLSPPNMITSPVSPTQQSRNANVGDYWLNTETSELFILVSLSDMEATWVEIHTVLSSIDFVTDIGTAIPAGGILHVSGGAGITTLGSGNTVTVSLTVPVSIANGGTNATSMTNSNGVVYFDGTRLVTTTVGTAGQILTSQGVGMPPLFAANTASSIFDADSGSATPAAGVITLHGTGDVSTSAAGSTVTFHGEGVTAFIANSGTATASLNAITIDGGTGITTSGAGSIVTINAAGSVATTFAGDSGTATPSANTITMHGGNNITTSASGSTVTYNVSGTTNHSLQLGNSSGSLSSLGVATNGQLPIGSTGADPVLATITAGTGISVTNGAGSITIANSGSSTGTGVTFQAFANSGTINPGTIVYIVGSGLTPTVDAADSIGSSPGKWPAVGVATTTITTLVAGTVQVSGIVSTVNGGPFTVGDVLYLATNAAAGNATTTRPTGSNAIQPFGIAVTSNGALINFPDYEATLPNLNVNAVWVGGSGGVNDIPLVTQLANGVLTYSSSGPTFTGSTTTQNSLLYGGASNTISNLGLATNGQLPIGNTGSAPTLATITAGTNISVTNGAGSITIAANSGAVIYNYTSVNHAASPYTVLSTDYYIGADVTAGVISILLPNAPTTGRVFVVKDKVGLAATSNITVTTVGGAVNIDASTSFVMNTAYEAISLIFNGTSYEVY